MPIEIDSVDRCADFIRPNELGGLPFTVVLDADGKVI